MLLYSVILLMTLLYEKCWVVSTQIEVKYGQTQWLRSSIIDPNLC